MLFPFFGGKTRVAALVWEHLGNPELYVEPFAGSLAVLLARPDEPRTEIVCDLDGYIANFWRAIQNQWPEMQAHLTGLVSEIDLRAQHNHLLASREGLNEKLAADYTWCDARLAALWWMGISSYLGSGFGHRAARQRPHIDRSLKGAWATGMTDEKVEKVMRRIGHVIVLAGDWQDAWRRSATKAIINRFDRGVGVFLDPPYSGGKRATGLYAEDQHLNKDVTEWALDQPHHVRIVIAGYADEYPDLAAAGWDRIYWKAPNGYAQKDNSRRKAEVLYVRVPPFRRRRVTRANPAPVPG